MAVKQEGKRVRRTPPKTKTPPPPEDVDLDEDDFEEDEEQEETPASTPEVLFPDETKEELHNVMIQAEALCAGGAIAVGGGKFGQMQASLRKHLDHELEIQSEIAKSFVAIAQTETKLMQEALKKKLEDLKDLTSFVNGRNGKDN